MEVYDHGLDAFKSATHAQLWARELGKSRHLFPIFGQTLLSLSRWENQATTMLHDNLNAERHLTSSLIWMNHWKILKNPQNGFLKSFENKMVLIDRSGRICTRELKEEALRND